MQDDEHDSLHLYNLSRRRVLGGIGAIGIASAGAGLGTSAYFSDVETFEDNALVAGSLDLKVDWEEHYYRGFADDLADLQGPEGDPALIQVHGQDPTTVPENYVGLPDWQLAGHYPRFRPPVGLYPTGRVCPQWSMVNGAHIE